MEQDRGTATTEDRRAGTAMRVIICGSRTWTDVDAIRALLKTLPPDSVIVHGAAPGADTIAGREAHALGLEVEAHPSPNVGGSRLLHRNQRPTFGRDRLPYGARGSTLPKKKENVGNFKNAGSEFRGVNSRRGRECA